MHQLRVFAPARRLEGYLPQFLDTCGHLGVHPVLLGAGLAKAEPGPQLLRRYLEDAPGHRLLLYLDPRRCVLQRGPGDILDAYRDLDHPLVVGGRRAPRPGVRGLAGPPPGSGPYRWPDADFWVGEADALLELFDAVADTPPDDAPNTWQVALERHLLDHPDACRVDGNASVFMACADGGVCDLDCANGLVRNRVTGDVPCVLHGERRADLAAPLRALGLPAHPHGRRPAPVAAP